MTEFESHSDIDDELLSAYLDDELSSEERARVAARIASDPAAKSLLDELRAASSKVQGLPREIVGHDLSESVLRRHARRLPAVVPYQLTRRAGPSRCRACQSAGPGAVGPGLPWRRPPD
jgi:anti-sigma factor RsiW